ncbi:gluconate 2-dehydrogenase alpha chain [Microcella alkaliphila]|uniref:Gluconate 2-dehydrogenase alpha chain n=1 Tax=Microcella alkaliphila TaxID=279828 RepID=A0A4Q7TJ28_9MICO|nr:GMC family oxidoreductase [Microcella alkaliphila]RZT60654.1 gluconate 2-dehydrogenase alpha chain [Microcella alkaliphila]
MRAEYDAIIVGMGSAGGIIAEQLTKAGAHVLALEKGPDYTQEDFMVKQDELRYYQRGAIVAGVNVDPVTWRPNESSTARVLPWSAGALGTDEPLYGLPSIGTGGGTLHWGCAAYRFREADFRMRSAIAERFGEAALPEGSSLADWPISYADLEPYYERVEQEQGLSGRAGNVGGVLQEGGNPFDPPRERDYPMPPVAQGPGDVPWVAATERLGLHPFRQPLAINSEEYRGRPACVNCGFCHGFPCHVKAKSTTQVTSVPAAKATGNLELRARSRVLRINRSPDGREVRGVTYVDALGETHDVFSNTVVLTAYALENVRLMLISGINANGQVGQHFMTHNFGWFTSVLPEVTNPFMGTFNASSAIDDYTSELVPDNDLGVLWGSPIISVTGDLQPIEAYHNMNPGVAKFGLEFKHWMRDKYRHMHRMYSQTTNFPYARHYADLDPVVKDRWGQPALRITHDWEDHDANSVTLMGRYKERIAKEMGATEYWMDSPRPPYHLSTHDVGVHRMGLDPATSVTNVHGEVHECRGLFAVGGGQFVSYGGYNPNQTVQALAYLSAEGLLASNGLRLASSTSMVA